MVWGRHWTIVLYKWNKTFYLRSFGFFLKILLKLCFSCHLCETAMFLPQRKGTLWSPLLKAVWMYSSGKHLVFCLEAAEQALTEGRYWSSSSSSSFNVLGLWICSASPDRDGVSCVLSAADGVHIQPWDESLDPGCDCAAHHSHWQGILVACGPRGTVGTEPGKNNGSTEMFIYFVILTGERIQNLNAIQCSVFKNWVHGVELPKVLCPPKLCCLDWVIFIHSIKCKGDTYFYVT